jgi:hypothetical protein
MLPSGFEITSFLADPRRGVFFLGSRQGALACYDLSSAKLVGIWRRIHDDESVRSIQLHHTSHSSRFYTEIFTTGRNCAYQILGITIPDRFEGELPADIVRGSLPGVEMQYIHRSDLNRGWLEGVFPLPFQEVTSRLLSWTRIFCCGDFMPRNSVSGTRPLEN